MASRPQARVRRGLRIETGERAVIAFIIGVLAIVLIWVAGGHDIAWHELALKIGGTIAIVLAFPFIYGWKFFTVPAKLEAEAKSTISSLNLQIEELEAAAKSGMKLCLHEGFAYEAGRATGRGMELPPAQTYGLRVSNPGGKAFHNCQLSIGQGSSFSYLICAPFDLRPGEYKDLPIIRIWHSAERRPVHVYCYYYRNDQWCISDAIPMLGPGIYDLTAFASNSYPALLSISLSINEDGWTLTPCN